MDYYPKQALQLEQTIIRRNRVLPPRTYGEVVVNVGQAVNAQQAVARGEMQQDFRIYDIAEMFNIRRDDEEKIYEMLTVTVGSLVAAGQELVTVKGRRRRRRVPAAPANGSVVGLDRGRLILQINPQPVEVYARMPGTVVEVLGNRGVTIEAQVALVQGRWGNGKAGYSSFAFEPEEGLASYRGRDARLENLRGRTYILQRPLTGDDFRLAIEFGLEGLVAPIMPYQLIPAAMRLKFPVILLNGFSENRRKSDRAFKLLKQFERQRQAAFDAHTPDRWTNDQPEIIIPLGVRTPGSQIFPQELRVGNLVRLTRAPFTGVLGEVVGLSDSAEEIGNRLRTSVARVKLETGDTQLVPLANLELIGTLNT